MTEPFISFIIIAHNAEDTIRECISSIIAQKACKEIILVNNNSADSTVEKVADLPVKIIYEAEQNRGKARNRGLDQANGDYIAFVDADVVLPEEWAARGILLLESNPQAAAVGGPGYAPDGTWISRALNILQYGNFRGEKHKHVPTLATMDFFGRGESIRKIRFSPFWAAEDPEFCFQLTDLGYQLLWSPELWVWHHHTNTFPELIKKSFQYGKWYPAPYWRHPRNIFRPGFLIRLMFLPVLLILLLGSLYHPIFTAAGILWGIAPIAVYSGLAVISLSTKSILGLLQFVCVHASKQYAQLLGIWAGVIAGTGGVSR